MKALSYLIIVLLTPTLLLLNFRFLVFNQSYYQNQFKKLNVYQTIDENIAIAQSNKLIAYLCCNKELDAEFYTQREKDHLKDVKSIIQRVNYQLYINLFALLTIAFILTVNKKKNLLQEGTKQASVFGLMAMFLLFVASIFNFEFLFVKFHQVTFANDYWLLPQNSNLINLFPQEFFVNFANRIAFQTVLMLTALLLITQKISKKA